MLKGDFLKLVRKHLKDTATPQEEQLLLSYYSLFENEPDVLALLSEEEKETIKEDIRDAIKQNIYVKIIQPIVVKSLWRNYIKYAVAILLCAFLAGGYFVITQLNKPLAYQYITPKVENTLIHFPDGSIAVVMKNSKITYGPDFNNSRRDVYLEGQAYFNVVHDVKRPFIVHTGNIVTTVLGTAFNVSALTADGKVVVTVTRGKVSVGDNKGLVGTITPNQQIVVNRAQHKSEKKTIPAAASIEWTTGNILFDDVNMDDAAKLLMDRFDVDVELTEKKNLSGTFTTSFQGDATLIAMLNVICEVNNATYTYDKQQNKVVITGKTN
jgi:transmembrane sensor